MSRLPIFFDLETHLIKPGMNVPKLVCMAMVEGMEKPRLYAGREAFDMSARIIREEEFGNHHVFYDLGVMAAEDERLLPDIFKAFDEARVHCTKIRQMMIDNANGELKFIFNEETGEFNKQNYHLWRLVQRHKGYSIQKKKEGEDIWRLRFNELDGLHPSQYPKEAREYALGDPVETRDVWVSQQERDIEPDEIPGYASEMRAAWALNLFGTWGFRTDEKAVLEFEKELKKEFAEQVEICQKHGFRRRFKGKRIIKEDISRDMKAIRKAIEGWYSDNGLEMKITEKGQIATDREQLTGTDHEGLNAVAESVRVEKLLTTYVAALKRGTEVPINPNYNPIIETFRTSCSGGMKIDGIPVGINVQNLPRKGKVRECVIPREGFVFAFSDYDTLEMRTLAQVCLDLGFGSTIGEAAKEGMDFHLAMAADMLGISYRECLSRFLAGDEEIKNARQYCKIANYGLSGGMGAPTFVKYAKGYGIIISLSHAKKLHRAFRARWMEMNDYFNHCSFICHGGNGDVEFVRSKQVRGNVPYTAVCNGFFQHLAAKGAKEACYEVARECYVDAGSPLYGSRPWLFAHDEIGIEIPYEAIGPRKAHEAAVRLQQVMIESMVKWVPDVPIGASIAMTRRWHKGAEKVVKNGIIVPVKPEGKSWVPDRAYLS